MPVQNIIIARGFPQFNKDGPGVHVQLTVSCAGCDTEKIVISRDGDWVDWEVGMELPELELLYCMACQKLLDEMESER